MPASLALAGVYAAALTPVQDETFAPIPHEVPALLDFLARRGCHGALLLGTTGEGPSFSPGERAAILQAAVEVRQVQPDFRLLAGTGTPSLDETISLTRAAFEAGMDGVVVLPPYYFRKVSDDGLFAWFAAVLQRGVPQGGKLLGYHIPAVSGVPLSIELLARLKDAFPDRFAGLKDSSGDPEHARQLGSRFGSELLVLTGNDSLLSLALQNCASGCITAMANLVSPELRQVWDAHFISGESSPAVQARLDHARQVMDRFPPAPPLLKALLSARHAFPLWAVRPPLLPFAPETIATALAQMSAA